jgi:phage gp36-like protein
MGYFDSKAPSANVSGDRITDAQISYAITSAEGQVDLSLRKRYDLPLNDPVPSIVVSLATDIAAYLSDLTFRGNQPYQNAMHPMRLRYERANLILSQIAGGSLDIFDTVETDIQSVYNPYPGDVLLTTDVFPRGFALGRGGEYSETERIPYSPFLRNPNG